MTLTSGNYTIYNINSNAYIGRHFVEDRSLHPRRVIALPQDHDEEFWTINVIGENKTTLSTRGGVAAAIDGYIFARLVGMELRDEVKLNPTGREHEYTITHNGGHWFLPSGEEGTQVKFTYDRIPFQNWRIVPYV